MATRSVRVRRPKALQEGDQEACRDCGTIYLVCEENFYLNTDANGNKRFRPNCRSCHSLTSVLAKRGMTLSEYFALGHRSDWCCEICGRTELEELAERGHRLSVDHCHKSGSPRGLLCSTCNWGLGSFQDNIDLLEKAIAYIRKVG